MKANAPEVSVPPLKQLVLVGGGHSHLFVLMAFARKPIPGLEVILISEDTMTGYSGMLPGLIAGQYEFNDVHIDLRRLTKASGIKFIHDRVSALDADAQTLICKERGEIRYDWLSINTGSTPSYQGISDVASKALPVKPIKPFLRALGDIERRLDTQPSGSRFRIGVVGAGAAGVEVALSLHHRFTHRFGEQPIDFHLFSSTENILPTHNEKVRDRLRKILNQRSISTHAPVKITSIDAQGVSDGKGYSQPLDEVVLVTTSSPQRWLSESGLAVNENGFVQVNDYLQSVSHENVFAAGDVADMVDHRLEKAGVFAVRQGKPLARNIRNMILGSRLKAYKPQQKWLALLNAGNDYAVASKGNWSAAGRWVWRWKDHIDRKFMKMFHSFEEMGKGEEPRIPEALKAEETEHLVENLGMRCAGCGSKAGDSVLTEVISKRAGRSCEHVEIGLGQPDDAAVIELPPGQLLAQSLDYFSAPLDDPYLVGKLAAVHSLSDLHAMGAAPHSAMAIVTLPLGSPSVMSRTLEQVLAGAETVFEAERVCLVGGHTTEGPELVVGFSVNGTVDRNQLTRKQGLKPGDRLLLTKPLGSGVLLAAHSQLKAEGVWIDKLIDGMSQSNGVAAEVLADFQVSACTDVTGFGFMGHLAEMLKGCDLRLDLSLDTLPLYDGALSLSNDGIRSSLFPENVKVRHVIANLGELAEHPVFPILFDPQTAGGLLVAVPEHEVADCTERLQLAGVTASDIGTVSESDSGPEVYWH